MGACMPYKKWVHIDRMKGDEDVGRGLLSDSGSRTMDYGDIVTGEGGYEPPPDGTRGGSASSTAKS